MNANYVKIFRANVTEDKCRDAGTRGAAGVGGKGALLVLLQISITASHMDFVAEL